MHATLRRLRCARGTAAEVAELIEAEYVRRLQDVDDVLSYTIVDVRERRDQQSGPVQQPDGRDPGRTSWRRLGPMIGSPRLVLRRSRQPMARWCCNAVSRR